MRLAYVITDLDTGGVPLHLSRVAPRVRAAGVEPMVISLAPLGEVAGMLEDAGVPCVSCNAAAAWDVRAIAKLVLHLRRFNPDVVHALLFHANMACRVACPLVGVSPRRLICEIQTVEIERTWHLTVGGMAHRLGRFVVGNSPSVVEHLHRHAHMPRTRLRCVLGGVDAAALDAADDVNIADYGVPNDGPIFMWVGRMDPVKGLYELVAAFEHICRQRGGRLVLIGDGPQRPIVERDVRVRQLDEHVHLLGRQTNVAGFLRHCDVFVLPSYTEGMPNALLEAMVVSRPVVATNVPGSRDVVTHGGTGLLVPPRDVEALAGAMDDLRIDRRMAERLGKAAREHCLANFTLDACVSRYRDLYNECLDG